MRPHLYKVQIQEEDINPNYPDVVGYHASRRWIQEAHEDLFRNRGLDLATLRMHGCLFVPSKENTKWAAGPILPDDEPIVETQLGGICDLVSIREGKYSELRFVQKIKVADTTRVISDLILVYYQAKRKAVVPQGIRSRLES